MRRHSDYQLRHPEPDYFINKDIPQWFLIKAAFCGNLFSLWSQEAKGIARVIVLRARHGQVAPLIFLFPHSATLKTDNNLFQVSDCYQ